MPGVLPPQERDLFTKSTRDHLRQVTWGSVRSVNLYLASPGILLVSSLKNDRPKDRSNEVGTNFGPD